MNDYICYVNEKVTENSISMGFDSRIMDRVEFLYGLDEAKDLVEQIKKLLYKYELSITKGSQDRPGWTQDDAVLITYGDVILPRNGQANKLQTLAGFIANRLGDAISTIHILPFFPSSSDSGFSVSDYKSVRDDLGSWQDVEHLSEDYRLMADLVINHTSRSSKWFQNYQIGEEPGKDYFIEMDPATDLSKVTRPRSSSLLSTVETIKGMQYVWTTFSDDQIDLDFSNPKVLLEFIDIFLFYISKGIRVIRMDAVAYLWKKAGTNSIHLKETHQIVKLFRDIADHIQPEVTLITETNVPFEENMSYFGDGDEAHMIYQFSLPPLLLHAILTENAEYLSNWASTLPEPPEGCTYFNFTSSHDGIGVRPLEGLVPDEEFHYLAEGTRKRGGFVSFKNNPDGSQSPYELNITYFDAFSEPNHPDSQLQIKRYLCSQIIMLSLQGVPGIYFHNLTATKNYIEGITKTGQKRTINRKQWQYEELKSYLANSSHTAHIVLNRYKELLNIRKSHAAFSPQARQEVLDLGSNFFGLCRDSRQEEETILCISNITSKPHAIDISSLEKFTGDDLEYTDLLSGQVRALKPKLKLDPLETVWLLM